MKMSSSALLSLSNANAGFTLLAVREDVHAGLICLNVAPGLMSLKVQKRLFELRR